MHHDPFKNMAAALEIESKSKHPDHKVGALVCGKDSSKQDFRVARSNFWPPLLEERIGRDLKLGNASTTVHAEIAALCSCPTTEGAELYLTDLPCPNCAKAMAEARISAVYIDSHTHNTPLGLKIKPFFDDISLPILKAAGISVFEMNAETHDIHTLSQASQTALHHIEHPITLSRIDTQTIDTASFQDMISTNKPDTHFAACFAKSPMGNHAFMLARAHKSIGLKTEDAQRIISMQNKYLPTLQPINRLLLNCARHGFKILPDYIYSSQTPTSREFVNLIGAGYTSLSIGDITKCRDEWGLIALAQLQSLKIITVQ